MKVISYILYFILFFGLFYAENFEVGGGIKFSQAWKIPLIFLMLGYVVYHKMRTFSFNKVAYLMAFKQFVNEGIFRSTIVNIIEFFRYLNLPLLIHSQDIYFKSPIRLYLFILRIGQYFILSSLPFLLGILKSVREGVEFGDNMSYTGFFQSSHSASIITCFSILIIVNHVRKIKLSKLELIYNVLLILLGLYCLYLAFVRTGYLMLLIGLVVMFFPKKIDVKQFFGMVFICGLLSITFVQLVKHNKSFEQRIFDLNARGEQREVGSGRLVFIKHSIDYWSDGNSYVILFGRGIENIKDNLYKKIGIRIVTHNGYTDMLVINGVVGLALFFLFLGKIFYYIRKNKNTPSYRFTLAIFLSYITFLATQGGVLFTVDLILASSLVLLNKEQMLLGQVTNIKV